MDILKIATVASAILAVFATASSLDAAYVRAGNTTTTRGMLLRGAFPWVLGGFGRIATAEQREAASKVLGLLATLALAFVALTKLDRSLGLFFGGALVVMFVITVILAACWALTSRRKQVSGPVDDESGEKCAADGHPGTDRVANSASPEEPIAAKAVEAESLEAPQLTA